MKLFWTVLLLVGLVGCASRGPVGQSRAITYDQLQSIKVTNRDCPNIDQYVNFIETQLRYKGLLNANPEDLNEDDRKYNATARIVIWSLRIGCNNPDRYSKL